MRGTLRRRIERTWPTVILGAAALLALLVPATLPAYRVVLILAALLGFWWVSPTRILFGERMALGDAIVALGAACTFATSIARAFGMPWELAALRSAVPFGVLVLLGAGIWFARSRAVHDHGLLAALRQHDRGIPRDIVASILVLLCTVGLAYPILILARDLHPLLCIPLALALAWRPSDARHLRALSTPDGLLLSVSGLLLLRLLADTLPQTLALLVTIDTFGSVLSLLGLLALVLIPAAIWRTLLLLRATHDHAHLPAWPAWLIGVVFAALVAMAFAPIALPETTLDGRGLALVGTGTHMSDLLLLCALGAGLVAYLAARWSERAKTLLMLPPFLAGAVSLLAFGGYAFTSDFLADAAAILISVQNGWYASALAYGLLFAASGLILVLGSCGFLYDVLRD